MKFIPMASKIVAYSIKMLGILCEHPHLILKCDESTFSNDRVLNFLDMNSGLMQAFLGPHRRKFKVAGITMVSVFFFGPYFFQSSLAGWRFLRFLRNMLRTVGFFIKLATNHLFVVRLRIRSAIQMYATI